VPEVVTGDGVSIHYEVWGRRAATPVLMIQGLGADSRGWALQRMAFGRRHRCYALDNRGVGQSDRPPGPYSLDRMAGDAIAVLDQEGIESAHVMGASMGGVIAQILAVLHPGRVRSLTLACTRVGITSGAASSWPSGPPRSPRTGRPRSRARRSSGS